MYRNQHNIDFTYIEAGNACYVLNKYLNKWLNQTDIISNDDERFLRKIIKTCSDVSQAGCDAFRKPFFINPIYYMTDGGAVARFEEIVSALVDVGIITEKYEYDELKAIVDVLMAILAANDTAFAFPVPSIEEWFWRFKCKPKEVC